MTLRDVPQLISIGISLYCLWLIARKIKRQPRTFSIWLPMITIMLITLVFYALVQLRLTGVASSDLSATRNLAIQIALMIYVRNMPPVKLP